MNDDLIDVLAIEDKNGEPVYANTTVIVGETRLIFKNGRAKCTLDQAPHVALCEDVTMPGYDGPVAPPPGNVAAPVVVDPAREQVSPELRARRLADAQAVLASQGVEIDEWGSMVPPQDDPRLSRLEAGLARQEQQMAELKDMLALAVGLEPAENRPAEPAPELEAAEAVPQTPEPPKAGPPLVELTTDGKPRCQARKADGSQCTNPSMDGTAACKLVAHRKRLKID